MPANSWGRTLLCALEVFRPAFSRATFPRWRLLLLAWLLCLERHAFTECLVVSGTAGLFEHSAFHRVFSRRRWSADVLGRLWLLDLLRRFPSLPLRFVVDDTLGTHKGPRVFGLGNHLDAVRSTRKHKVFAFGHVWVVCALVVRVPFSSRPWAFPLLFRLYRNKKECLANGGAYASKTQLARELLELLQAWLPQRELEVLLDRGYCNRTVLRDLPTRVCVFGSVNLNLALTASEGRTLKSGRHSAKGERLSNLEQWAAEDAQPWEQQRVDIYGGLRDVECKTRVAQWWPVLRGRAARFVVVRTEQGAVRLRALLCTDASRDVATLLTLYAERWSIEVFFFEAKQYLGFAASKVRLEPAVRRVAPCVGLLYGVLTAWFWWAWEQGLEAEVPRRPWYGQKTNLSFEDVLRTARAQLRGRPLVEQTEELEPLRRARRRGRAADHAVYPKAA